MEKIKIVLGAYIDSINAQDINCYEIAKRLDQQLFEIHVFYHNYKRIELGDGVIFHKVSTKKILKNIDKIMNMLKIKADVYYLPRVEKIDILFAKIFGKNKCIVSSVEIQNVYENNKYNKFFNRYIYDYFCISNFLNDLNLKYWNKKTEVLYLGSNFGVKNFSIKENLRKIAFVGSLEDRKKPFEFLKLAINFPNIEFVMIGSGSLSEKISNFVNQNNITNVKLLGKIPNDQVVSKLCSCELLVIVSEKEGLPKVVLEAASVGVPTAYISKNYRIDYIENNVNGFEAYNTYDVIEIIKSIQKNKSKLKEVSYEVKKIAEKYSWDRLIKDYNKYFSNVYYSHKNEKNQ